MKKQLLFLILALLILPLVSCTKHVSSGEEAYGQAEPSISRERVYIEALKERLSKEDTRLVEVQVSLSHWVQLPELRELISKNNAPQITELDAKSENEGNMLHITIPLAKRNLDPLEISRYLEDGKGKVEILSMQDGFDKMLKGGVDEGIWTYSFRAYGSADEILEWWNQHPSDVRIVQSVLYRFDRAQKTFSPDEEI